MMNIEQLLTIQVTRRQEHRLRYWATLAALVLFIGGGSVVIAVATLYVLSEGLNLFNHMIQLG